ncbi:MAG TPA: cytochrome c [Terriglobales bacterium]|jgi:mono/diheme cytochrome c family protein|nr:cytochrome c [Terriglobales bacterium]
MKSWKPMRFMSAILVIAIFGLLTVLAFAQDEPIVGPKPPVVVKPMESHIGNLTGHSVDAKSDYRRYCAGCHGDYGDGNGENAVWLDPKPRDFTIATFKCRSTLTGTLPTDQDLFNTIARGLTNSNMPIWNTFSKQQRANLVAYIKIFSPRWDKEKAGTPISIPAEPPVTIESISHGQALFAKLECWKCHGTHGEGDGPSASTLTDSKDNPIRPYNFSLGKNDSRFKCGSTNQDIYKIFMTGVDGTPMPSFADVIQPNDAWDLVHFLRTLQVHRHSKENDVLMAAHGVIPPYQDKSAPAAAPAENKAPGGGQ